MCAVWTIAGTLQPVPALSRPDLLAKPVAGALAALDPADVARCAVAEIDPTLADTAEFCGYYGSPLSASANCVVVAGKRGDVVRYAACLVLATTRADVNGVVRKRLDARKASFAPMDDAVELTGMAYGGITPIGLPLDWPVLLSADVAAAPELVIGSGVRHSKLLVPGDVLAKLPGAEVLDDLARPA
jgi:prolyl-tRNA editing enzyme YbaK/EbsC (Cys-tRNA(Pro) deacylase)